MGKRLNLILAGIIAIVFAVTFSTQFDEKLHISGDNAVYLKLARNMADGHGYTALGPDGEYHPASHFPPGYSFFLSVFIRAGIDSLVFFKAVNSLLLLGSLLLLFFMFTGLTKKPYLAFAAVSVAIFSPQTLGFATIVMSEMFYMFLITLGFYGLYRYGERMQNSGGTSGDAGKPAAEVPARYCFLKDGWFWTAVASIAAGYYTRSVAMSAIGAAVVFFAFRRQWKQALVYVAATTALLFGWSLRNSVYGIESRYFGTIMTVNPWRPEQGTISSVGEMVEKMIGNFDETVIKGFREILFPFLDFGQGTPSGAFSVVCGFIVLAVIFYGAWKTGPMRWAFISYLVFNIGLFLLWHGGNGSRYVTPIAPVLFVCFYTGIYYLMEAFCKRRRKALPAWAPLVFLVMVIPALKPLRSQAQLAKYPYPPAYENYFTIARQLNRQAPAGTVVVARKPDLFNYFADRLVSVNYRYTTDPLELIEGLVESRASYVVLEQLGFSSTPLYLYPAIEAHPELFQPVWRLEDPDTYLLEFDRTKAVKLLQEH